MRLEGFIGPAYQLDSVNVDAQACVNLYPEVIESGKGKAGQVAYLRGTPGLEKIAEIGPGPIRLIHVDSIGRVFVVSGNQIYSLSKKQDWRYRLDATTPTAISVPSSDVDVLGNEFDKSNHGFVTGLKVRLTSSDTLPAPLLSDTDYYVIRSNENSFAIASSLENALSGNEINVSDGGSGTHTITPQSYGPLLNVKHSDIDFSTGTFVKQAHGYPDGMVVSIKASGPVVGGIDTDSSYYITNRTDDSFRLAESLSDALDGVSISITDIDDQWYSKLLGDEGEYGGGAINLSSSSGVVIAASMSTSAQGQDSSTVLVDGTNNYLLKDENGDQSLSLLGPTDIAEATISANTPIVLRTSENIDDFLRSDGIKIQALDVSLPPPFPGFDARIYLSELDGEYLLGVNIGRDGSLTTAELVQFLNTGTVPGKDVAWIGSSPNPFTASGGDSTSVLDEFNPFSSLHSFSKESIVGGGFGSVKNARHIVWSDGYFILNESETNRFFVSDLQGFNVDALSFASSEGSPDILLSLAVSNRYLYAFNEKTTEIYANTGNADFPYERIQGGFIEVGLAAEYSVAKAGEQICFLGRTGQGQGIVYAMNGVQPKRISTHAIEQAIKGYADISSAKAFAYEDAGHSFYVLSFDEATWVFDFATGLWHQRAYLNAGDLERHRAEFHAYDIKRGIHLVSDYATNEIYQMREDYYTDDGDEILRIRSAPHISNELKWLFYRRFQLDMEVGIGLSGGVQGSNPTVMLDWSDDGGHTWSSEQFALADAGSGQIGDFKKRVQWRRLGKSRDRIFRVKISDPVKVRLIDAQIDADPGVA